MYLAIANNVSIEMPQNLWFAIVGYHKVHCILWHIHAVDIYLDYFMSKVILSVVWICQIDIKNK